MPNNYSTSVNVIRDENIDFNYIPTPNASKAALDIFNNIRVTHAFNIIGSYGTGKSSFLWALEKSLKGEKPYFGLNRGNFNDSFGFIKLIGEYASLRSSFNEYFGIKEDYKGNQLLFEKIFEEYEKLNSGLLVIIIDEFGKHLEYASKNSPEEEIYFIQKLAEFVNAPNRNIILITSQHQNFNAYSQGLEEVLAIEWRKIEGRFKQILFNEPIEQLLHLAFRGIQKPNQNIAQSELLDLLSSHHLFKCSKAQLQEIVEGIYPFDIISIYALAICIQKYGQNERSLFNFLNSDTFLQAEKGAKRISLDFIYDYVYSEFYSFIVSKVNPDYSHWAIIKDSIERAESLVEGEQDTALKLIKSIGLLNLLATKGARIDLSFLKSYYSNIKNLTSGIKELEAYQIIRYNKFSHSYKLFEGTDLDINHALATAQNQIDASIDIYSRLGAHLNLKPVIAKAISFNKGTPRIFEFIISNTPVSKIPIGEVDGYINLILNNELDITNLIQSFEANDEAILFGILSKSHEIELSLIEIEKVETVLKNATNQHDKIAQRELKSIKESHLKLLEHYVTKSFYNGNIRWFDNTEELTFQNIGALNQRLSLICQRVYHATPTFYHELINRHKVSGSISTARNNLFKALVQSWEEENFGFPEKKWPAEKTIYYSLLKRTGIHRKQENQFELGRPEEVSFHALWDTCDSFLGESVHYPLPITELQERLKTKPFKLKEGFIDFWIPIFLFIRRSDFALYKEGKYLPQIKDNTLHFLIRSPKDFALKGFQLSDLRLELFNRYRAFLHGKKVSRFNNSSFIETIRPLLTFYQGLPDYSKKTNSISLEVKQFREAIVSAKDPENTFFVDIPNALGYNAELLVNDSKNFDVYIQKLQSAIEELRTAFQALIERLEACFQEEVFKEKLEFPEYKLRLIDRYSNIRDYKLNNALRNFINRLGAPIDDRDSWISSLSFVVLNKPLEQLLDTEEPLLKEKFIEIFRSLDNLSDLSNTKPVSGERLVKLDITTEENGMSSQIVRIQKNELEARADRISEIEALLEKENSMKIPILTELLRKALTNE
ncbi:hypothetical protein OZ410_03660 [Robiginitalea sp. M366]|uniref:hypothetical protein n=1 Tax=Robiginitalea aestuariiviva TaxID=3036903 RepID=UPI00240DBA29|nr:hypothetical protein [Robiginitalea aestuariiviva]MDG1571397.1 hypothetical protein [Robiginitalea aestuariiviva]